jgi:hypothetical protein
MARSVENWLLAIVHELCRRRARADSFLDDVAVEERMRSHFRDDLSCRDAERAISLTLDARLPRRGHGALRAHLRRCEDCTGYARSHHAQRLALRSLIGAPIPRSLSSFFAEAARGDPGRT